MRYLIVYLVSFDTDHGYELFSTPVKSWAEAKTFAASQVYHGVQGHLLAIETQLEDDFISSEFGFSGASPDGFWIAAYDNSGQGTWPVWASGPQTGANVGFTNFDGLQTPAFGCVVILYNEFHTTWTFDQCSKQYGLIVEYECPLGQVLKPNVGCVVGLSLLFFCANTCDFSLILSANPSKWCRKRHDTNPDTCSGMLFFCCLLRI
jgi:hypothetical protein